MRHSVAQVIATRLVPAFALVTACATRTARSSPIPCVPAPPPRWAMGSEGNPRLLRVWIDEPSQAFDGWSTYGRRRVTTALDRWNAMRLPVRLTLAENAREAQIVVNVVDTLPPQQESRATNQGGLTVVTHGPAGAIARAHVFVAVRARYGVRYRLPEQQATLLHELGHAIGLPHATGPKSLMSERRFGSTITGTDIVLARSVYGAVPCESGRPPAR